MVYSRTHLYYKPPQCIPILNTVGSYNEMVSICIYKHRKYTVKISYYNFIGLFSYIHSDVDKNVIMQRMTMSRAEKYKKQ